MNGLTIPPFIFEKLNFYFEELNKIIPKGSNDLSHEALFHGYNK